MDDKLLEIAVAVAQDCITQRDKFAASVHRLFYNNSDIREKYALNAAAAFPMITAFQIVNNHLFVKQQKYVSAEDSLDFMAAVFIAIEQKWTPPPQIYEHYFNRYEANQEPYKDQMEMFCQDIAKAITGSDIASILGLAFVPMAHDFLLRNKSLIAAEFDDENASQKYIDQVRRIHGL